MPLILNFSFHNGEFLVFEGWDSDNQMGNTVGSIFSGVGQFFGNILGHPLDFLSGKSCKEDDIFPPKSKSIVFMGRRDSVCAPTWDFFCYIENFCVAQLLKFVMVAILVYFVLLFFYLLFSLGICQCICRTLCHIIWAFFSAYISAFHDCFSFCFHKLRPVKRRSRRQRRRIRDVEEFEVASGSSKDSEDGYEVGEMSEFRQERNLECKRSQVSKRKKYKEEHLKKSLRPNSHRAGIELSGNSYHLNRRNAHKNVDDHVRVTRTSKFSNKGSRYRSKAIRGGR